MRFLLSVLAALLAMCSGPMASAHEFWISPLACQIAPGENIKAHLRVGQMFQGASYPFMPGQVARNGLAGPAGETPLAARVGDMPAMHAEAPGEGLWVLTHQTTPFRLTYNDPGKFTHFIELQGLDGTLEAHAARGLPEAGFEEYYTRYAKALIAVGHGAGKDREVGFETEIVALANPYVDDVAGGLPVLVLEKGAPRAGVQVELFGKREGAAPTRAVLHTDSEGKVLLPVAAGHEYLVSAVAMRPTGNDDPAKGPVWHSHWAALSFCIP